MAVQQAGSYIAAVNNQYHITTRAVGLLQAGGGVVEGVVGSGVTLTGLGTSGVGVGVPIAAGGGLIMLHGADQASTGLRTLWTGRPSDTLTSQGLQAIGMSPTAAHWTDAGLSVAFTAGGSSASNGSRSTLLLPKDAVYSLDAAESAGGISTAEGTLFNGITGPGPLGAKVANTFRSGSYTEVVTSDTTTLYRVYGGKAGELGPYWTRTEPQGPLQSVIDSALDPAWGNNATRVVKIEVPSGVKIYEGVAAQQRGLVGGGNQVFVPRVDESWIVR